MESAAATKSRGGAYKYYNLQKLFYKYFFTYRFLMPGDERVSIGLRPAPFLACAVCLEPVGIL